MALCSRVVSRSLYSPICSYLCTEAMSKEDLDAFFAPPCTVCGSTSLDRGLFAREVELPAVKLNTLSLVSKFLSHLSHVILKYPLLKRVVSITDEKGKVCFVCEWAVYPAKLVSVGYDYHVLILYLFHLRRATLQICDTFDLGNFLISKNSDCCIDNYFFMSRPKYRSKQFQAASTVRSRFKATLFNNYEARGRIFWRLKNYIEVLVSHI